MTLGAGASGGGGGGGDKASDGEYTESDCGGGGKP